MNFNKTFKSLNNIHKKSFFNSFKFCNQIIKAKIDNNNENIIKNFNTNENLCKNVNLLYISSNSNVFDLKYKEEIIEYINFKHYNLQERELKFLLNKLLNIDLLKNETNNIEISNFLVNLVNYIAKLQLRHSSINIILHFFLKNFYILMIKYSEKIKDINNLNSIEIDNSKSNNKHLINKNQIIFLNNIGIELIKNCIYYLSKENLLFLCQYLHVIQLNKNENFEHIWLISLKRILNVFVYNSESDFMLLLMKTKNLKNDIINGFNDYYFESNIKNKDSFNITNERNAALSASEISSMINTLLVSCFSNKNFSLIISSKHLTNFRCNNENQLLKDYRISFCNLLNYLIFYVNQLELFIVNNNIELDKIKFEIISLFSNLNNVYCLSKILSNTEIISLILKVLNNVSNDKKNDYISNKETINILDNFNYNILNILKESKMFTIIKFNCLEQIEKNYLDKYNIYYKYIEDELKKI